MELADACPLEDPATARSNLILRSRHPAASFFRAVKGFLRAVRLTPKSWSLVLGIPAVGLTCLVVMAYCLASEGAASLELANLATVGKNAYFNLEPGYRLRYTDGSLTRTMTVRRRTKFVDGVETRVIEEKEEKDGQPTRVLWKYYAFDKSTTALYCFGVHVQSYHNGRLVSHSSLRRRARGAAYTLAMPAAPKVGDTLVRGQPKQVYEVIETAAKVVTPAGTFTNCLRTRAKGAAENKAKVFAPGVGLVKDGQFTLVKISQAVPKNKADSSAD